MELYQHFQDTKRRCGWAARRYTVKLHANNGGGHNPGWKFHPAHSSNSLPALPPGPSSIPTDTSALPVIKEVNPPFSKPYANLIRSLLTFAAEEVRPLNSLLSGSVFRLLHSTNPNIEYPCEDDIRQFLLQHKMQIETSVFAQLPLLNQSAVVLSLHGNLQTSSIGTGSNCLTALWNCFISNGIMKKCLFAIRRYSDVQTSITQSIAYLDECRERQKRTLRSALPGQRTIAISIDPSFYLHLPLSSETSKSLQIDFYSMQSQLNHSKTRLLDDFCYRLWQIFTQAVRKVEYLPRLLTSFLKFASHETENFVDYSQTLGVSHLKQLSFAVETLSSTFPSSNSIEIWRQYADYKPLLESVVRAGQYFESAIQRLHKSGISAGSRLPLLLGLQKKLATETDSSGMANHQVESFRRYLVNELEQTFNEEVSDSAMGETSFSLLATFADPQYKLFWVDDPEQEANYRDRIVKYLTTQQPKVEDSSTIPSSVSTSSSPSSTTELVNENGDGLLDFVAKRRRLAISSAGCDWPIMDEVQTYLGNHEEAGPLDFWASPRHQENYPNVYRLHLEVHSAPSSCLDTSLQLGVTNDVLSRVATSAEWQRETDEVLQCLILAKFAGYEFRN